MKPSHIKKSYHPYSPTCQSALKSKIADQKNAEIVICSSDVVK